jgi:hypothetical protein
MQNCYNEQIHVAKGPFTLRPALPAEAFFDHRSYSVGVSEGWRLASWSCVFCLPTCNLQPATRNTK